MTQILSDKELEELHYRMKSSGINPPEISNLDEQSILFSNGDLAKDSCYLNILKSSTDSEYKYVFCSFGCYERNINKHFSTEPRLENISSYERELFFHLSERSDYIVQNNNRQFIKNKNVVKTEINQGKGEITKGLKKEAVNSFIFYDSFFNASKFIADDKLRLEYLDSIMLYGLDRETSELSPTIQGMFELIKPQLDANYKRRMDGQKGGRPKATG